MTYIREKEISFFVGRDDEIKTILQVVQVVVSEGRSRGIILEGPGGCGKSTLFGRINQLLWKEAAEDYVDLSSSHVISAFVLAPENARSFRDLWRPIFEGLEEQNCSFFEKLACQILSKLLVVFHNQPEEFEELKGIIWESPEVAPQFRAQKYSEAISKQIVREFAADGLSDRIPKLIEFVSRHTRQILRHHTTPLFRTPDTPESFVLDRVSGIPRMQQLLKILGTDGYELQNSFYLHDEELIKSDDDAFAWFNWFDQTLAWIFGKAPCFLIGIDDIGKISGAKETQDDYFQGFFNTLIRMRNALGRVAFVLIGTTDDWHRMDSFVNQNLDLRSQVQGFLVERISLSHLEPDLAVQVFENRMEEFWTGQARRPRLYKFYPFDSAAFRYIYDYKGHQIRDSLNLLHNIWQKSRRDRVVQSMLDYFQTMKLVRTIENDWPRQFLPDAFHLFERMAILNDFWDPTTFKTKGSRSTACEQALAAAFQLIADQDHPRNIDRARCNPTIKVLENGQERRRRPDVFVEFFGQLGPERARAVEFQVKIYEPGHSVDASDLRSSFDLLEFGALDLLYLIMTGAGLTGQARMDINAFQNRVMGLQPINDTQLLALVLLTRYQEITGSIIDLHTAKAILEIVLNRNWEQFVQEIRNMPKNYPRGEIQVTEIGEAVPSTTPSAGALPGFLKYPAADQPIHDDVAAQESTVPYSEESPQAETYLEPTATAKKAEAKPSVVPESKPDWTDSFPEAVKTWKKDIRYFFTRIMTRGGRWKGQTTVNYLIKDCPPEISPERLKQLFKMLPGQTSFFLKEKTSVYITEEGQKFAKDHSLI
jgi:hypothetical protein